MAEFLVEFFIALLEGVGELLWGLLSLLIEGVVKFWRALALVAAWTGAILWAGVLARPASPLGAPHSRALIGAWILGVLLLSTITGIHIAEWTRARSRARRKESPPKDARNGVSNLLKSALSLFVIGSGFLLYSQTAEFIRTRVGIALVFAWLALASLLVLLVGRWIARAVEAERRSHWPYRSFADRGSGSTAPNTSVHAAPPAAACPSADTRSAGLSPGSGVS